MVTAMGSVIRWVAVLVSLTVALGFAMFAVDEIDRGSKTQQSAVDEGLSDLTPADSTPAPSPSAEEERLREQQHGGFREAVDDANDVLLAPFTAFIDSSSNWVNHGIPALLALLLYGGCLGMLANALPKKRHHSGDWRTA